MLGTTILSSDPHHHNLCEQGTPSDALFPENPHAAIHCWTLLVFHAFKEKKKPKQKTSKEIQYILKTVKESKRCSRRDSFPSYAHCHVYYKITSCVEHSKRNQGSIQLCGKEKKVRAHFRTYSCTGLSAKYQLSGKQLSLRENLHQK